MKETNVEDINTSTGTMKMCVKRRTETKSEKPQPMRYVVKRKERGVEKNTVITKNESLSLAGLYENVSHLSDKVDKIEGVLKVIVPHKL